MANWIQLVVFLIVLAAPALSWLAQRLKEQAERKRLRAQMQKRRDEEIRTGRPQPEVRTAEQEKDARLRELAARREAQLRDLVLQRQQQQQQGRGGQGANAGARPGGGSRKQPAAGRGAPADRQTPRTPRSPRNEPATEPGAAQTRGGAVVIPGGRTIARGGVAIPSAPGVGVRRLLGGDADSLRSVIAAAEVLGPPVALRGDDRAGS